MVILAFSPVKNDPILVMGVIGLTLAIAILPGRTNLKVVVPVLAILGLVGAATVFLGGRAEIAKSATKVSASVSKTAAKTSALIEKKLDEREASLAIERVRKSLETERMAAEAKASHRFTVSGAGLETPVTVEVERRCGAGIPAGEISIFGGARGHLFSEGKEYRTSGDAIPPMKVFFYHGDPGVELVVDCGRPKIY